VPKFKFSLLENAIDFLLEAISDLNSSERRKLKHAVIHLCDAVELVFKARLVQEHWSLAFNNPGKATRSQFESGDFSSVDFQEVQDRLANVCNIDLSKHRPVLRTLRKVRNRVEHFALSVEVAEVQSVLIKTWSFLWDFLHKELSDEIATQEEALDQVRAAMHRHEGIVKERLHELEPEIERARLSVILACPVCLQDTLSVPGGDDPFCLFCHYRRPAAQVADDWAVAFVGYPHTDPKEASLYPVLKECEECGSKTMIEFDDGSQYPPDPAWVCFNCGISGSPTTECESCGMEFDYEPEVYRCSKCRSQGEVLEDD
jgi:hypothetical protein